MAEFNILNHFDSLKPDGGTNDPRGDHSFLCPVCEAPNFKVHITTGKWGTFSCDCANTESGKRKIRDALSPAINPSPALVKPRRPKQERHWDYFTTATLKRNQPAITVNRWDDPDHPDGDGWKNCRKINQTQRVGKGKHPYQDVAAKVMPYGLPEALEALADGAPFVLFVEGEPCVDACRTLGIPAICNLGGSGKFDPDRDGPTSTGIPSERLVVTPDRDQPGIKHAQQIAAAYPGCQWLYPFPGTPEWNGSCPPSGGLDIVDWIAQGASIEQILGAVTDQPWGAPVDPVAPVDEFLKEAESLKRRLDDGLTKIDAIPDVATRSVALLTFRQELGLGKPEFEALLRQLSEAKAPRAAESFEDLMAADDADLTPLVEDLFPTGLILLAAEGFAGKSNTAYQVAEAVTNGSKFAGQFQCRQAPALIIQMDESSSDARRKWTVMGLQPAKGQLTLKWNFSPMMFPELRQWITDTGSKLVILDPLVTIAGGTISPKDAEFGLLIYRLNQLASELQLTILCLHHVVKGGGKPRTEITKDDIFGTAYVYNGSSEAWGLWQSREDNTPDPIFNLRCLKSRSGIVDAGVTYQFNGDDEDRRLTYRGMAGRTITLNQIRNTRARVLSLLQAADGAALDPKHVNERLQLGNADYARRLCRELYEQPGIPVGRKLGTTTTEGGRPAYLYFWAGAEISHIPVPKPKPPTPQSQQRISGNRVSAHPAETSGTVPAQIEGFRQGFSTTPDPSEREEREGVERGFRDKSVSRTREAFYPDGDFI
jgi:hypothetical protein